jgi:hypothetical protein
LLALVLGDALGLGIGLALVLALGVALVLALGVALGFGVVLGVEVVENSIHDANHTLQVAHMQTNLCMFA